MGMIAYEAADGIATLTLSRPEKLNALTSALLQELRENLDRAAEDRSLRVLVLTGAGRAFCAGQDLGALTGKSAGELLERDYTPVITRLMEHPLVTVAAFNGLAAGAGVNLALSCDFAVAAESVTLAQLFVRIGLIPDAGGTWLLPRLVGLRNAMALTLTGDTITAREAKEMGLVYRVFPDATFAQEVAALARRLAGHSPDASRRIKRALRESFGNTLAQQLSLEARLQDEAAQTGACLDAVAAFTRRQRR